MLQIYNTLTQQKETFTPIQPGKIQIYVCGMTVYDYCHLGHARVLVTFDVVTRYLRAKGYDVNYVNNITDIDDKIIKRAQENNETISSLTARFIQAMHEDISALNVLPPDHQPRATEYIQSMISMIQTLMEKGFAYQAHNKDILYRIKHFENYGALSHRDLEGLHAGAGARVEINQDKQDPLDFVLWKHAKSGEPYWDSPWGPGRPGWHIECSAMSTQCLGPHFDIHGGGFDLIFPHHENEIAQSEAAMGEKFVNTWMHVGFIQVNKEKMSKSLGNFFTIREILAKYPGEVVRYFMLTTHYRSPINYSLDNLEQAKAGLERLYLALRGLPFENKGDGSVPHSEQEQENFEFRFNQAMDDDFNTPIALTILFEIAHEIQRERENILFANGFSAQRKTRKTAGVYTEVHDCRDRILQQSRKFTSEEYKLEKATKLGALLRHLGDLLGILQQDSEQFLRGELLTSVQIQQIENLITQRNEARTSRDWARADEIRDQLDGMGIMLEDTPSGTSWRRR